MKKRFLPLLLIQLSLLAIFTSGCGNAQSNIDSISMPPGFKISIYASEIEGARSLTLGENGVVFVGSRSAGRV